MRRSTLDSMADAIHVIDRNYRIILTQSGKLYDADVVKACVALF